MKKTSGVLYFGSYDPGYSRNRIIKKGLLANGVNVLDDQAHGLIIFRYVRLMAGFLKDRSQITAIIVGFPGHYDVPLAFVLGKLFGKKVFYDIFTSTYETYVLDREVLKKNSFRARLFYFIDRLGLKLADYVIVDTIAHGKLYSKMYNLNPKKQIVVYVGSDTDYFYPRKVKETTDVLFYGSYQPLQGTDVIIKAASSLPEIKFKMIGEGQTRDEAEELAKNLKLKNIEFVNWLPLEELSEEIAKAKITLGIFGNTQKAHVVIPNKVYDYVACAKPVITGDTQAARELLENGHNAALVPLDDHALLAKEIANLIKNAVQRQSLTKEEYGLLNEKLRPNKVVTNLIAKMQGIN